MKQRMCAVAAGALALAICWAPNALAQDAAAAPPPAPEGGAQTHDGFYLQIDLGLGYLSTSAESGGVEVKYSGMSFPFQLLLGGSPMDGLAIGGGFIMDQVNSPGAEVNGQEIPGDPNVTLYLFGMGLFADYYPDPHGGLHFQGFFGWGGLEATYEGNAGGSDPTGMVIAVGAGHDWWMSDEWSIGVLGRIAYAPLTLNDIKYNTWAPGVMASFTYH